MYIDFVGNDCGDVDKTVADGLLDFLFDFLLGNLERRGRKEGNTMFSVECLYWKMK